MNCRPQQLASARENNNINAELANIWSTLRAYCIEYFCPPIIFEAFRAEQAHIYKSIACPPPPDSFPFSFHSKFLSLSLPLRYIRQLISIHAVSSFELSLLHARAFACKFTNPLYIYMHLHIRCMCARARERDNMLRHTPRGTRNITKVQVQRAMTTRAPRARARRRGFS